MKHIFLTLILYTTCIFCFGFHPVHVPHMIHVHHHSIRNSPKIRTTPKTISITHKNQPAHKIFSQSGIPYWILIRPHHHNDTYNIDGKELKLCPICHKKLINKYYNMCNTCKNKYKHNN